MAAEKRRNALRCSALRLLLPLARFEVDASESRVVQLALSASTASGTRSITRRRARAAPCGTSLPCSQPRTVATDMPIRRANSACDSPARLRTRRTQAAASLAASASSKAAWRSISASVVASTRAQSVRGSTGSQPYFEGPAERRRVTAPVASRRASVRAIPVPLPGVCLAGGDDPRRRFTPRVGDHEEPSGDAAVEPEAFFAIVSPNVTLHPSVRIEERRQDIGKTEPAISHAAIVFRIIPLEPDMGSVRQ